MRPRTTGPQTTGQRTARRSELHGLQRLNELNEEHRTRNHVSGFTHHVSRFTFAFTLIEIAICLAVIGFSLVAIIGILPLGMQVQKDNRQETIIDEDAQVFLTAIRNGSRNMDDLTNYVMEIHNYYTDPYVNTNLTAPTGHLVYSNGTAFRLDCGNRIIGLLSTPKISPSYFGTNLVRSNYIVAYVRSISGAAAEKYPQNNPDVLDSFNYRMNVDMVPFTDYPPSSVSSDWDKPGVAAVVQTNLYDIRLTFRWPVDINFVWKQGGSRQVVRMLAGGTMTTTNDNGTPKPKNPVGVTNYFLQPNLFYGVNAL